MPTARRSTGWALTTVRFLAIVALLIVASCSSHTARPKASSTATSTAATASTGRAAHKVLVVLLENHSQSEALAVMPHLRRWAHRYGSATDYHAVAHPSLPNYLAIWGGSTFGIRSDCSVGGQGCRPRAPSVFTQTINAGQPAVAYQESMASNCQTGSTNGYAPKHGPWPYWTSAKERKNCSTGDVPAGTTTHGRLASDIAAGRLPVTGELTPNLCHDAHDCSLASADRWLAPWMARILAGPDYRAGRLTVIITFDEDDSSQGNRVAFVVVDPRLHGKTVSGRFDHYSLTRWLDDNAGLHRLRHAATAKNLRGAFGI